MSPKSSVDLDLRPQNKDFDNTIIGKYEKDHKCHHFTSDDHIRLGTDLAAVFYKVLISSPENNERLKVLMARYINYLHKTPPTNNKSELNRITS